MSYSKRLDNSQVISSLIHDVLIGVHGVTTRNIRNTRRQAARRFAREGDGFFTKTLPRLGKSLDRALTGETPLDCLRFRKEKGTQLPIFLGELFKRVFNASSGMVLRDPCTTSVKSLRQILFVYYKLELPYDPTTEQSVLDSFIQAEKEVQHFNSILEETSLVPSSVSPHLIHPNGVHDGGQCASVTEIESRIHANYREVVDGHSLKHLRRILRLDPNYLNDSLDHGAASLVFESYVRDMQILGMRKQLHKLLCTLDLDNIRPKHGPGAVSTKETLEKKYSFVRLNPRLHQVFPYDQYFMVNMNQVAEGGANPLHHLLVADPPAKVILVPKDSRGPRLISCEPLENQWIQQGIMKELVKFIENHPLTKGMINFTDQAINQELARSGSITGGIATLDLKEASDRVSMALVERIFPRPLVDALYASRSLATTLPDKSVVKLGKFAPMGSALCFPVMALTIWAALTCEDGFTYACSSDATFVYGDDVIVPTAQAVDAIARLERIGLKVNADKSFTSGFFRESCGMDAFHGVDVTPCRIKTPWRDRPEPGVLTSYVAQANELYEQGYPRTAALLAANVVETYGQVPVALNHGESAAMTSRGIVHLCVWPQHQHDSQRGYPSHRIGRMAYRRMISKKDYRKHQDALWELIPLSALDSNRFFELFAVSSENGRFELIQPPTRYNQDLQRIEILSWSVTSLSVQRDQGYWERLLRYFSEYEPDQPPPRWGTMEHCRSIIHDSNPLNGVPSCTTMSTGSYTPRRASKLALRWR